MREKKILILGAKDFHFVSCYDWGDKDLPNINIPDYDIVIVNVVSLTKNLSFINVGTLENIKSELIKLLVSNGELYAIACPIKKEPKQKTKWTQIDTNKSRAEHTERLFIDNYMWSPIPLNIINKKGDTINEIEDELFKDYFKNFKEWSFVIKIKATSAPEDAIRYCYEEDVGPFKILTSKTEMVKIAKNRMREAIAAKFYYQFAVQVDVSSEKPYSIKTTKKSGDFILLPLLTEINDREAINFILEKCLGVVQRTPPPPWAKPIPVPGLKEVELNLEEIENDIDELNKKKIELKQQEAELASYKELLYETGIPLEEIVRKVFTELGFPPKTAKFGEEYIIEFNNTIGIIECKGITRSISRRDFRQLLDYVRNYETEPNLSNLKVKGILIANAWRNLKPEERGAKNKPIFPAGKDGVIERAERHHIALVNTVELFNIFCKFLDGKIEPRKILETIFKADGIVKFPL